jgi:hypothetical protein
LVAVLESSKFVGDDRPAAGDVDGRMREGHDAVADDAGVSGPG